MQSCRIAPFIFSLFAITSLAPQAQTAEFNVQVSPVNARIQWQLGGIVHTSHGSFQLKNGDLWVDTDTGKMRGELVVDAASGESGNSIRDGRMRSSVLETKQFPNISFRPDSLQGKVDLKGTSEVQMHGLFNIHGKDHELVVPAKLIFQGNVVKANLQFQIPYVEWGMKDPSNLMLRVDKIVKITIQAEGHMGKGL